MKPSKQESNFGTQWHSCLKPRFASSDNSLVSNPSEQCTTIQTNLHGFFLARKVMLGAHPPNRLRGNYRLSSSFEWLSQSMVLPPITEPLINPHVPEPRTGCGSQNRNSKMGHPIGKWKHGPRPAVCPPDRFILIATPIWGSDCFFEGGEPFLVVVKGKPRGTPPSQGIPQIRHTHIRPQRARPHCLRWKALALRAESTCSTR